MIAEHTDGGDEDLSEELEEKDAQVLQRESMETELMDDDESEIGEEISGVEESPSRK